METPSDWIVKVERLSREVEQLERQLIDARGRFEELQRDLASEREKSRRLAGAVTDRERRIAELERLVGSLGLVN